MAGDQHEALMRAFIDEVFNGHRLDALDKYWDDYLTSHWLGMESIHGAGLARGGARLLRRLSGGRLHPGRPVFAHDGGVWRGRWKATQQGEWQGVAASGRNVTWSVIIIGLFRPLGCIPTGARGPVANSWPLPRVRDAG